MGVCLALYLLGSKTGNSCASKRAEEILDYILSNLHNIGDTSFDKGLSGIGWAVNLLHMQKILDGSIDDILYNIDAAVYRQITKTGKQLSISLTKGLNGYMAYLISRISNPKHDTGSTQHRLLTHAITECINRLCEIVPTAFMDAPKDMHITSLWDLPLTFLLMGKALSQEIYKSKIIAEFQNWSVCFQGYLPYYNTNKLYLAFALQRINAPMHNKQVEKQIKVLLSATDLNSVLNETDYRMTCINEGWFFTSSLLEQNRLQIGCQHPICDRLKQTKEVIHNRAMPKLMQRLRNSESHENISFINGLSGIAVSESIFDTHSCESQGRPLRKRTGTSS